MTKEQAEQLAERICSQFPFHIISVVQAVDMRNAPQNWLIGIHAPSPVAGKVVLIHSELEWEDALLILEILKD